MILYVDDIILAAPDESSIQNILLQLQKDFIVDDLGPLRHYLGFRFDQSASRTSITM